MSARIKIINREYDTDFHEENRLIWVAKEEKPWTVYGHGIKHFPTHAEAIAYADLVAQDMKALA